MILASMTGFARAAGTTGPVQWAWEVRSVNGRGLDVRLRVPAGFDAVGEVARTALQRTLTRGQCQLTLALNRPEAAPRARVNVQLLAELAAAVARVPVPEGLAPATMDGLLGVRGVIEFEEDVGADPDALARDLAEGVVQLVAELVESRRKEGRQLLAIVDDQVAAMERLREAAEACPARRPEAIRTRLAATIATLTEGGGLDPDRLHQEALLMAGKADVREELDRLAAHLASVRELLA
ncbi:MAG TPA: YicC/YloC family endoribonuclease, partial [Geminicoccaceae bacterium]